MQDTYMFPAIFEAEENGISIFFPDLPGCLPCGETPEKAVSNAKEALKLHLYGMEEDQEPIPTPTPFYQLKTKPKQTLMLIEAYMPPFREKQRSKFVKKTLSIPSWLNAAAMEKNVNFSLTLQNALIQQLNLG